MANVGNTRCTKCGSDNREGAKFCSECATSFAVKCPRCGAANKPAAKFCDECAASLAPASTIHETVQPVRIVAEQAEASALDGERKTVTALFADIKGSTELMEELDPEEARAIIDPALKLMIDAVRHYDGYVVQSTGDGIFALFGAPVAHEDHPQRTLYAALRMQEELKRHSDHVRADGGLPIQARIGVNTGEVVVRSITTGAGQTEYTPIGHTTNLASRMQTLAPIGSIAATEVTRKLCEGYFILKPLGATKVKGVSEPVNVYEVTGLGPLRTRLQRSVGRGLTKFVGREREMEALKHAAEQAKSGHGQIVAAMAEPGVGKSRLFFEFKAPSAAGWMVLETFSISHGKASAYMPVIDLLRNYFRIANEDDERTRREKVNGKVLTLDRALQDTIPYLFSLLGIVEGDDPLAQMDGQVKKRRTLEAIKRIVLRESLNQPLMVIFEDLHWIDEATQELLNLLADSIGTAKILLLVNYRPEYSHQWSSKTYYTQLRLDPLGVESAEAMLNALLGDSTDLAVLKRMITEKTEGNPFFMEEMVQNLFEQGALLRNGEIKLTRPLSGIRIPTTVQAMLTARIDRLQADEKDLLQTLAVIGREFPLVLVARLLSISDDELNRMLSDLQQGEFIYEQPAAAGIEYIFKHALTQEVAYNSILTERRQQIHERAAQAIESLFAASLADHYTDLAHHYGRSGNASKAVNYLHLAAQQAMSRSAYAEARDQLTAALELIRTLPDNIDRDRTEIAMRFSLAFCILLSVPGAFLQTAFAENLERARDLCEKIGDDASRLGILAALVFPYSNGFQRQKARAFCEELLSIATRLHDSERIGHAWCWLAFSSMWEGNFVAALEAFEQAYKVPLGGAPKREVTIDNWRTLSRSHASLALWVLGYPARAASRSGEALLVSREIVASPSDMVATLNWSVFLNNLLRDPKTAYPRSDEARRLAHEHGFDALVSIIGLERSWVLAQIGQVEEGLSELLRCQKETIQIAGAAVVGVGMVFLTVAEVDLIAGRRPEGLEAVNQGLEAAQRTGTGFGEAELQRLKGELLLLGNSGAASGDSGAASEAAQCFRDAIEVARWQSAKSWELRATMSLARLLAKQARRDEARAMLTEIYNWFTEGFDTADLKDAKALLDELSE
jgi:class 3 adenylate cyclase/tetratricopeptide (TPR) repeat protein